MICGAGLDKIGYVSYFVIHHKGKPDVSGVEVVRPRSLHSHGRAALVTSLYYPVFSNNFQSLAYSAF
jgi:hypothetical protein